MNLTDILTEVQALETTSLKDLEVATAKVITDLTDFIAAQVPPSPVSDPVVEVDVKTQSGAVSTFVPKV